MGVYNPIRKKYIRSLMKENNLLGKKKQFPREKTLCKISAKVFTPKEPFGMYWENGT